MFLSVFFSLELTPFFFNFKSKNLTYPQIILNLIQQVVPLRPRVIFRDRRYLSIQTSLSCCQRRRLGVPRRRCRCYCYCRQRYADNKIPYFRTGHSTTSPPLDHLFFKNILTCTCSIIN